MIEFDNVASQFLVQWDVELVPVVDQVAIGHPVGKGSPCGRWSLVEQCCDGVSYDGLPDVAVCDAITEFLIDQGRDGSIVRCNDCFLLHCCACDCSVGREGSRKLRIRKDHHVFIIVITWIVVRPS